ncbi:putative F-box/FBD/LRR-repeat protein At4g00315 [Miscanthus floridulus]|uniref:putative F-box/FBD/LRR-repeat protein At4g00315 n=1 Tax=Miscanthus floridulus TaxID=154761 RepID=UPI00345A1E9B
MPGDMRAKKVAAAPDLEPLDQDRISALPDAILQYVLGFLPADEAVKTCVHARHWRHQWRSVRRLRINYDMPRITEVVAKFVNCLLLLRAPGMALDEFEVSNDFLGLCVWIPLEVVDVAAGRLSCLRILSQSVKDLRIINSRFVNDIRACISMPSLISLQLKNFRGKAPLLEFMPSLQTAFVKPANREKRDACMKKRDSRHDYCGSCANCCGADDHRERCVLLGGLSNAVYLELIAYYGTFIFKRDLRWCPTFSKLKTLLLNEWYFCLS